MSKSQRAARCAVCVLLAAAASAGARPGAADEVREWIAGGPAGTTIRALAVAPGDSRLVFAGTDTAGLFRSTNGGDSWQPASLNDLTPQAVRYVGVVVIDDRAPLTVYAHLDDTIFKSTDGGATWEPTGLDDELVTSIAIDPVDSERIYAAAFDHGVFRSSDGGATWEQTGAGLPTLDSFDLVVDAAGVVYAGSDQDEGHGGVFVSLDGGDSWEPAGLQGIRIQDLAIDAAQPGRLLAAAGPNNPGLGSPILGGVFITIDGGASWQATGLQDVNVTSVAIDAHVPTTLYATVIDSSGRPDGVLKSIDDGSTWQAAGTGLPNPDVFAARRVVTHPTISDVVYVATDGGGVWESTDGGEHWRAINRGLPLTRRYEVTALATGGSGTAYAAVSRRGIFRTSDQGATWEEINAGLSDAQTDVRAIAVDPNRPSTVYATTWGGVLKSDDGGGSWTSFNRGLEDTTTQSLTVAPTSSATLYALTNDGVFKTIDAGATWRQMNQGLGFFGDIAFAIAPGASDVLYLAPGTAEIFKSVDGSRQWERLDERLPALALAAGDAETVYVGNSAGIRESTDGGISFRQSLADAFVSAFAVAPATGTVYAAGEGVWQRGFMESEWRRIDDGLEVRFVDALAVSGSADETLYAAGLFAGVFVSPGVEKTSGSSDGCALDPAATGSPIIPFALSLAVLLVRTITPRRRVATTSSSAMDQPRSENTRTTECTEIKELIRQSERAWYARGLHSWSLGPSLRNSLFARILDALGAVGGSDTIARARWRRDVLRRLETSPDAGLFSSNQHDPTAGTHIDSLDRLSTIDPCERERTTDARRRLPLAASQQRDGRNLVAANAPTVLLPGGGHARTPRRFQRAFHVLH